MRLNEFIFGNREVAKTKRLTAKTLDVLSAHLKRLRTAGINVNDQQEFEKQISAWASKFFNTDYQVNSTGITVRNARQFVEKLVSRKLAGLDLNTGQPYSAQPPATVPPGQASPGTNTPNQPTPHQVNPGVAPVGVSVKVNAGTYTKTARGWVNEYGALITKPASIQKLEDSYQQNTRTTP